MTKTRAAHRWGVMSAALAGASGCALFTDLSTDGYAPPDAATAPCFGAADCDAGQVCCLSSLSPPQVSCQSAPCGAVVPVTASVQLCLEDGECDGGACVTQRCPLGATGASVTVRACGEVPTCSSGSVDASADQ